MRRHRPGPRCVRSLPDERPAASPPCASGRAARQVERVLSRHGFEFVSPRGSHRKWRHPETGRIVVVPLHGSNPLPIGTLRSIITGSAIAEDL